MPNRLAHETSPYLQQHADNPVDWYPWGAEALRRARDENKPILLSVGYSACHWCHVMAHESFEDPGIAEVMNRHFINIKVDREERPDIDQIYQMAHQLLTGRPGGWPLTMFLAPDQKPFFGGTYFPRTPRYNLPGFADLLEQVARIYAEQGDAIAGQNAELMQVLQRTVPATPAGHPPSAEVIDTALQALLSQFDRQYGGLGDAPKFPHPAELESALREAALRSDATLRGLAVFTLRQMALGGIFDQLGGGFYRYSTDRYWSIPHFEKMLYDNGPLLRLCADAWLVTGDPLFAHVCEQTAAWVMREMQSPEGGYYSSLDADSEHREGKFYVWLRDEVESVLTEPEYAIAAPHYGIDGPPNFEGHAWHLRIIRPLDEVARERGVELERAEMLLQAARAKLFAAREGRPHPGRDEKVLTAWNALMIQGMAHAGRVFGRADWLDSARRALDFVRAALWRDGRLLATYKNGEAHLMSYLDDHAFLLAALLEQLQARFDIEDLRFAAALGEALLERFEDRASGGFFFTAHDHEPLIVRPKPGYDNATPSGNGVAAFALQRLGYLLGAERYLRAAEGCLRLFADQIEQHPSAFTSMLAALAEHHRPPTLVVLRGEPDAMRTWATALDRQYLPATLVLAIRDSLDDLPEPLAKPKRPGVNAWVCEGVSCLPPIGELTELERTLRVPG